MRSLAFHSNFRRRLLLLGLLAGLFMSHSSQAQNRGFQINRYEPTAAGEWSFMVDHPWYSSMRYFAAGITLDYAHNSLIFGLVRPDGSLTQRQSILTHQLTGHIDLAGSFLDRVLITASLPITFLERGDASNLTSVTAASGAYVSDPRIGAMVRIFGQPYGSAVSLSAGGQLWVPLRAFTDSIPEQGSDKQVRGLLRLALGGLSHHVLWSATLGTLIRSQAQLGDPNEISDPTGRTATHELQIGGAVAYADLERRFSIGPEIAVATAMSDKIFRQYSTSLEILGGIHYNIASLIDIGVAGGAGILRQPGTPDARVLFRLAYAPMRKPAPTDRDHDGVADKEDRCPDEPQGPTPDPERPGCPARDRDNDGVYDSEDRCPDTARGPHPDPNRPGCPASDRDGDGVFDPQDQCPDTAQGQTPDPARPGCPASDRDGDGVFDPQDLCPDQPQGKLPDPARPGCPAGDKDGDGVLDPEDLCPETPAGGMPDPNRRGCPTPDRDRDLVPDALDACPDQPGAPDPDPKKNGCPTKLIEVRSGQIIIKQQVFFDYKKDTIQKKSFPLLQAVADTLNTLPQIKKVRIEGHTDNIGGPDYNLGLSTRRAQSVMRWLVAHRVDSGRLLAEGYGETRPIADNKTKEGQAKNRRVDFIIIDPPQEGSQMSAPAQVTPAATPAPTQATQEAPSKKPPPAAKEQPVGKKQPRKGKKSAAKDTPAQEAPTAAQEAPAPAQKASGKKRPRGAKKAGGTPAATDSPAQSASPATQAPK